MNSKLALVFDTETTGLPRRRYLGQALRVEDYDSARIVQMAWQLVSLADQKVLGEACILACPSGMWFMTEGAEKTHGISRAKVEAEGVPLHEALEKNDFWGHLERADVLVAHNLQFDGAILWAELMRDYDKYGPERVAAFTRKPTFCTMKTTTDLLRLPFPNGPSYNGAYKWPKLIELHNFLFGEGFDGAHDALEDVRATSRCLWALRSRFVAVR